MAEQPLVTVFPAPTPAAAIPAAGNPEIRFALRLAQALQEHGAPAHRLEDLMAALCRRMGLDAQLFSTPTAMFASFEGGGVTRTHLLRISGSTIHLARLSDLDAVAEDVLAGRATATEGLARLDALLAGPPTYGPWTTVAAYGLTSAAASRIFGGGLREIGAAAAIGIVTGLLAAFVAGSKRGPKVFEPLAAAVAAVLAAAIAWGIAPISVPTATLAGLIALVPGYSLTVALIEVSTRHLASGSARLVSALLLFLTIGFGVAVGGRVAAYLPGGVPSVEPLPLPFWTEAVAVVCAGASFAVIFRAHPRDTLFIVPAAVLGVLGARIGGALLEPEIGAFFGAFTLGIAANAFARWRSRPAAIPLVPAMMLLVPGRLALRSLEHLVAHDVVLGVQTAFSMILVAVALAAGLLFSHEVVSPRKAL